MIFRKVFFPASTVPKMYWGREKPTQEFQERQTIPLLGCELAFAVTFPWGNQRCLARQYC